MRRQALLLSLIAMLVPPAPAAADWIRTRDGALVETRGPWKVQGAMVIFTSPEGRLSSMRLSEVDLDGSAVATAEARKAPPPRPAEAQEEEREPVLELTNKDISRAAAPAAGAAGSGDDTEGDGASSGDGQGAEADADQTMRVVSWRQVDNLQINGIEIVGTVQNLGSDIASDLGVTVTLYEEDGTSIASVNAFLGTVSLAPRSTTTLRALFPDVYTFSGEPEFAIRNNTIEVRETIRPRSRLREN